MRTQQTCVIAAPAAQGRYKGPKVGKPQAGIMAANVFRARLPHVRGVACLRSLPALPR